jgi:NarL family two-component system sensor histidine kinase LiaS
LQRVLGSKNTTNAPTTLDVADGTVILAPIRQPDDQTLQGVLIWNITQNPLAMGNMLYLSLALEIIVIALVFCVIFTIIGTFFGFFTARGFTRRLERLSAAVERWSQGNFQYEIIDTSRDELGQAARQLNQMAQQLQQVFFTQRKLAVLEERNRLARELHDSVKQQVFSASMQLSTADSIIEQDTASAQKHIQSAESLIDHVQRELASVIHALRPVHLEHQSLEQALTDYVHSWEQQTSIRASLTIDPLPALSPELETACYRITQEALSNVARHSGARAVTVRLQSVHNLVTLNIHDNGHGFHMDSKQGNGIGLQSMHERVEELHGSLEISSDKRTGTTISITYPLQKEQS